MALEPGHPCYELEVALTAAAADIQNWMNAGAALFATFDERALAFDNCMMQNGGAPMGATETGGDACVNIKSVLAGFGKNGQQRVIEAIKALVMLHQSMQVTAWETEM